MENKARVFPSNTMVMNAFTQKLTVDGLLRKASANLSGMANPGMFINNIPSRATPRRISMVWMRSACEIGCETDVSAMDVVVDNVLMNLEGLLVSFSFRLRRLVSVL